MQINHFEFLAKYQEEILEKQYDLSEVIIGYYEKEFCVHAETRVGLFFAKFNFLNNYLINIFTVIDAGEKYYDELNNEIESWFSLFFEIFFKEFELTMAKDFASSYFSKSNQFFYFSKDFHYRKHEKDLLMLNHSTNVNNLKSKEFEFQINYKKLVLNMENWMNDTLIEMKGSDNEESVKQLKLRYKKIDLRNNNEDLERVLKDKNIK